MTLSFYDYGVILFYFAISLSVGFVFQRFNKDTSDYFRGGGSIIWQVIGATSFMSFISAFTYTGAAGKAYQTGTLVMILYFANGVGFLINALYFAKRYRQSRVVTAMEIVRDRFGRASEQVFTWMVVPFGIIHGGVLLYSLAIIIATLFGIDMATTILLVGGTVLIVSLFGGSWAVIAGDFIQLMVMVPMAIVLAVLCIVAVGGPGAFIDRMPAQHVDWSLLADSNVITLWIVATLIKQLFTVNNMSDGYRFLAAKDSEHASKAALMTATLFFTVAIVWFIPPIAAKILYPNIGSLGELAVLGDKAADGTYLAMGMRLLPDGMIGAMLCAIFAASMSAMDSSLNKNAGIFVRNFYQPILRKGASDRELMITSYAATLALGATTIGAGIYLSQVEGVTLFDLNLKLSALMALPFIVPLTLGMLIRDTPRWAGWSTVLVGVATSWWVEQHWPAQSLAPFIGIARPLLPRELVDLEFFASVTSIITICSLWFIGSRWLQTGAARQSSHALSQAFFTRINTPVDFESEHQSKGNDAIQFSILGWICLVYGLFFLAMILIPNTLVGRLCYLFMASANLLVGWQFVRRSRQIAS
jgi:SSS family transporter